VASPEDHPREGTTAPVGSESIPLDFSPTDTTAGVTAEETIAFREAGGVFNRLG
jgi:hypothetical protein